ncbi:MAG: pentapeptide repeat-containing protein, partial [Methylocella sp.]
SRARFDGAVLDQVWAVAADFSGASLRKANLFASQMQEANCDRADFSGARVAADLSRASLRNAKFIGANLAADMRNQSMGLMRAVLKSADLAGADFEKANLALTDLQFAKFQGTNLKGASLAEAEAGGADFRGAILDHTNFNGTDVASARFDAAQEKAFANAKNLERAFRE